MSFGARLGAWARTHRRAVGIGITVAALALFGVAVVLGLAVFSRSPQVGQPDATASVSPTPSTQPTAEPSASAEPTATPAASPGPTPEVAWPPVGNPDGAMVSGELWVVSMVNDLNIRSGAGPEFAALGQLDAGDIALLMDGVMSPEWVHVSGNGVIGYASVGPAEDPYLLTTPTPWKAWYKRFAGVASNGDTYVAYGYGAQHDYVPYEGGEAPLLLVSDDGMTWSQSAEPPRGGINAVAGGPAGWVALTTVYPGVSLFSFSADGRTWEEPQFAGGTAVAAGPGGWVMVTGTAAQRSADGRVWEQTASFGEGASLDKVESSDAGYVAYGYGGTQAWASPDGVAWTAIDVPVADGWLSDVELVGDRVLALVTLHADGTSLLLRGALGASGAVTWDDTSPSSVDGEGLRVDSISQGPEGLLALGWDTTDLVPALWRSSDGSAWQRLDAAPDAMGGSVGPEPAWGAAGWVGVGTSSDGSGDQLWRSTDGEEWAPTGDSLAYAGPQPPCPPQEEISTLVLMYLGRAAERCIGDASITIRAWSPVVTGIGGCCAPIPEPAWLAGPFPDGWLEPAETDAYSGSAVLSAYIPPEVDQSLLQQESWVEIVGHFRDPASEGCRQTPVTSPPMRLTSLAAAQYECRQRFVVESIAPPDGP